jgi:hypothetical protein
MIRWLGRLSLLGGMLLTGCMTAPSSTPAPPTPTATAIIRSTLPPTWTPTVTFSPMPPTPIPSLTYTPTPAPTRSSASICAGFVLDTNLKANRLPLYNPQMFIRLLITSDAPETTIRLLFTDQASESGEGLEFPGGQSYVYEIAASSFTQYGRYNWAVEVRRTGEETVLCAESGEMVILRGAATPTVGVTETPDPEETVEVIPSALATPSATP